jgi:transcription initiation factor TFIIIB Brf1 subunit/transcription initiation factor TFIIB
MKPLREQMMNEQELKPCPFCGSKDVEQDYPSTFVVCNGCKAAAKADLWNTRQHDKARYVEAIRSMKDQMPGLIPEYIKKDEAIAAIEGVE